MLYCEKAIINCDNYGGAITFDIAISGEKKETIAEKEKKIKEFMMKFPVRVCEYRKANEWKGSSESGKSSIFVSSQWNWELFLYGHERQ